MVKRSSSLRGEYAPQDRSARSRVGAESPITRDIFLSHRSTDKEFVQRLATDIESVDYLGRRLLTWVDDAEIRPGQSVPGCINEWLEGSRFVGLVMTPAYFESNSGWTDAEWHAALYRDPDNRQAKVLPLLAQDCPYIPILLAHLGYIDLRGNNYSIGLERLLRTLCDHPVPRPQLLRGRLVRANGRIEPASLLAGRAASDADPDLVEENLSCNLLPVQRLPGFVYAGVLASSAYRRRQDGTRAIPSKQDLKEMASRAQISQGVQSPFTPAFRLVSNKIITFHDLNSPNNGLASLIEAGSIYRHETQHYISDPENRKIVISLFAMGIERHLSTRGLQVDRGRGGNSRFYFTPMNGLDRVITWKPFRKKAKRLVTQRYANRKIGAGWLHQAAIISPVFLGGSFFLQITPTRLLTRDGISVIGGPEVGGVTIRWLGQERNLNILYHVRFWTTVLFSSSEHSITIRLGDQEIEVAQVPAYVHQAYGIKHDRRDLLAELDQKADVIALEEEVIEEEKEESESVLDTAEWELDAQPETEKTG